MNARTTKQTTTATATPAMKHDNRLPIAAGGALALLALGGAAVAMNRRRHEDEEWVEEESIHDEPTVIGEEPMMTTGEPAPIAYEQQNGFLAPPVSAFAWGDEERTTERADEPRIDQDDREASETWVQRAYRGPSALNPSVSLKTRLRGAAFFDKRERDSAAGLAAPVDPTAGLPDRMVDEDQREGEFA